jgi:erythromycin esterase-like protein
MVHTLENLMEFHAGAKGIIWEHNTHIEMRELRICVMMEQ